MKTKVLCGVLLMLIIQVAQAATGVYHVRDYGAKGDGKTLDHIAINKAIEAANADGGGKKVSKPYREQGTNYPEPRWAGPTPAYGLFARHVDGLQLRNVKFELIRPDERPDIILEDVKNYDSK